MKPAVKLELARPTRVLSEAAKKIEEGEEIAVKFRVPARLHTALKVRCAEKGLTLREYMLGLLERDGVS